MSFFSIAALRTILTTETDNDSPGSEELISQLRENFEAFLMLMLDTGTSGTATSDPSNDANGYFYDTAGGWTDDEHNGRTLLITSGAAIGNHYTIDDTVDGTDRLACTGDNLYADGVRSGDSYKIFFDLKASASGHNHDGINSRNPALEDDSIVNAKLHTATGSASGNSGGGNTHIDVAMHDYSFGPNVYGQTAESWYLQPSTVSSADYVGRFGLICTESSKAYTVYWRYVTATDEPFMYVIRDRQTGEILHLWMAEDPPPGCAGLDKTPENFVPPIKMREFDPEKHEELVSWKIPKSEYAALKEIIAARGEKPIHQAIGEACEYTDKAWRLKSERR